MKQRITPEQIRSDFHSASAISRGSSPPIQTLLSSSAFSRREKGRSKRMQYLLCVAHQPEQNGSKGNRLEKCCSTANFQLRRNAKTIDRRA